MSSSRPVVPQINLLPDVKINLLKARMQRNMMISVSILITVVCGVVMFILTSTLTTLAVVKTVADGNIENYKKKIVKEQKNGELNEYMTIQNQLDQISQIKKTQERMSLIFDYLTKLNPTGNNSMTVTALHVNGLVPSNSSSSSDTGTISFQGKTSGYAALNVIKLTMEKAKIHYHLLGSDEEHVEQMFNEVKISGANMAADYSGKGTNLSFTIDLKYNPIILAYNITNTSVEVPNETISDSRDNTPGAKQLFSGKVTDQKKDANGHDKSNKHDANSKDDKTDSNDENKGSTNSTARPNEEGK